MKSPWPRRRADGLFHFSDAGGLVHSTLQIQKLLCPRVRSTEGMAMLQPEAPLGDLRAGAPAMRPRQPNCFRRYKTNIRVAVRTPADRQARSERGIDP